MTTTHISDRAEDRRARVGTAPVQRTVVVVALVAASVLGAVIAERSGPVPALLFVVGLGLGLVLFHSRFGFTSAWRQLLVVRQGTGVRAHLLLIAVTCTLFAPILAHQLSFDGRAVHGTVDPIGVALVVGAVLFGAGMQLGGSCASGTLFAVGSGQSAIGLTLGGFVAGSTLGAASLSWWRALPAHAPVSFTRFGGYPGAWAISMAIVVALVALSRWAGRGRDVPAPASVPTARGPARILRGSWPLWVGALLLAGLSAVTLLVAGSPWGITYAFGLWGTRILGALGVHPARLAGYDQDVLAAKASVMDLGIVLGAMVASGLAGAWVLHRRVPLRLAVGAVVGGVMMGYGAQLADGCNIGAYLGGVASFSLAGWVWGVLALIGTAIGVRLRPLFGLTNPRPTDSVC